MRNCGLLGLVDDSIYAFIAQGKKHRWSPVTRRWNGQSLLISDVWSRLWRYFVLDTDFRSADSKCALFEKQISDLSTCLFCRFVNQRCAVLARPHPNRTYIWQMLALPNIYLLPLFRLGGWRWLLYYTTASFVLLLVTCCICWPSKWSNRLVSVLS